MQATGHEMALEPCRPVAAYFVREAWPSRATGTTLTAGQLHSKAPLEVTSRMDGGVVFADGIEKDSISFDWGTRAAVGPAGRTLSLVVG